VNFSTKDERVISGIILRERKTPSRFAPTNDTSCCRRDSATRKQTNLSIMPDGLFEQMKPDEVRDLVAYFASEEQVPLPK